MTPCLGTPDQQFWARVDKSEDCWQWIGTTKAVGSYGRMLTADGWVRAHRLAWTKASGMPIPAGFDVLHVCDNPPCVRNDAPGIYVVNGIARPRFGHLWLGTHRDNMADRLEKGRYPERKPVIPAPARWPMAKLTEAEVREIRRLLALGHTHRALAAQFGVSKGPITAISRGIAYKRFA